MHWSALSLTATCLLTPTSSRLVAVIVAVICRCLCSRPCAAWLMHMPRQGQERQHHNCSACGRPCLTKAFQAYDLLPAAWSGLCAVYLQRCLVFAPKYGSPVIGQPLGLAETYLFKCCHNNAIVAGKVAWRLFANVYLPVDCR